MVDLTPSAFDALLVKIRDAPRPLTLVFARGRCLAAVRAAAAALASKTAPRPDAAPRPRRDAAAPAVPAKEEAARAAAADLAPLCAGRVQLFADGERGLVRGVLACLDAPMRRRAGAKDDADEPPGPRHRRINASSLRWKTASPSLSGSRATNAHGEKGRPDLDGRRQTNSPRLPEAADLTKESKCKGSSRP